MSILKTGKWQERKPAAVSAGISLLKETSEKKQNLQKHASNSRRERNRVSSKRKRWIRMASMSSRWSWCKELLATFSKMFLTWAITFSISPYCFPSFLLSLRPSKIEVFSRSAVLFYTAWHVCESDASLKFNTLWFVDERSYMCVCILVV